VVQRGRDEVEWFLIFIKGGQEGEVLPHKVRYYVVESCWWDLEIIVGGLFLPSTTTTEHALLWWLW